MRCGRRIVAEGASWTTSLNVIEQVTVATPDDSHYSTLVYGWAKQAELHEEHTGDVPLPFRAFYQAFLDWRAAYNWDNRMADRLPNLFRSAGLKDIEINSQNEVAVRGDARFPSQAALWTEVMQGLGGKDIEINSQNEVAVRGDARFPSQAALWTEVMQGLGPTIVTAGFLGSSQLDDAASAYTAWTRTTLTRQTLAMKTVTGTRPE